MSVLSAVNRVSLHVCFLGVVVACAVLYGQTGRVLAAPQASDAGSAVLTGRVTDRETEEPLPAVNLFLSHTTRGTTTDSTGSYRLAVPPGSYELVVSMVGYKRQTTGLTVTGEEERMERDFTLRPQVVQTEELRVNARENTLWRGRFEVFREQFLGNSYNARKTTIENPYPIDFDVNPLGTLTATAPEPIVIVNRALGYRITFHLEEFRWNERLGSGRYTGDPFFEELGSGDSEQAQRWEENREHTYGGSLRHFMRAITAGKSQEEGFYVKRDNQAVPVHTSDDSDVPARLKVTRPRDNRPLWFRAIDADTLVGPTDKPHLYKLSFNHTLRVIYTGSPDEARLAFWRQQKPDGGLWVSWLRMAKSLAYVHEQGYLYNPGRLIMTGAMSRKRMADMLPYDYAPDE